MTLQQLKYIVTIAECGSISMASQKLYLAQPSLSKSVSELEKEMNIEIFMRSNRGVVLTDEGSRFLSYARQIIEQTELLENEYKRDDKPKRVFAVASQHYAFVVNAFVELLKEYNGDKYEFSLREMKTDDIIESIKNYSSDIGVVYLSNFNKEVMQHIIKNENMEFVKLFDAKPHVFVSRKNKLCSKKTVSFDDLQDHPRLMFDQGIRNSFYFSEEPHSIAESPKNIVVSDRATLFNLLIGLDGYTISSGILSSDLNGNDIVSIPLESDEIMSIGYVYLKDRHMNSISERYIEHLKKYISQL